MIKVSTTEKEEKVTYSGRFLGFMKDDQFNALVQNQKDVAAKIESKATQDFMKVIAKFDDLTGHRLVMTVRNRNGKSVFGRQLFISSRLGLITEVAPAEKATILTDDNSEIVVEEME